VPSRACRVRLWQVLAALTTYQRRTNLDAGQPLMCKLRTTYSFTIQVTEDQTLYDTRKTLKSLNLKFYAVFVLNRRNTKFVR